MYLLRFNNSTRSSFFTITLITWLLGLLYGLTSATPLTHSLSHSRLPLNAIEITPKDFAHYKRDAAPSNGEVRHISEKRQLFGRVTMHRINVPGVDASAQQVINRGTVPYLPSVFYSGWPLLLYDAQRWARCYFGEEVSGSPTDYRFVVWGRHVSLEWMAYITYSLDDDMYRAGYPDDQIEYYKDLFLKNLSQAFAELAQGDVILLAGDNVTSDDRSWDPNKAWGGWVYPALTRNTRVTSISRVDPNTDNLPRVIWRPQNGYSSQTPKGERGYPHIPNPG